jgi:hypothetical protein
VVEADIKSFFDQVNHQWLVKFLRHRIGDERVIRLIIRMLKSGIMEDGLVKASELGTPQGSILSPLLSNVYLHYVLDLWFRHRVKPQGRGEAYYFRFADDFLACFESQEDARGFRQRLEDRLEGFGLQVAGEKTRSVMRKGEMLRAARRRIIGHLNYYAITDNSKRCSYYVHRTTQIMFKWLNRKSQRRAYTWADFNQALIWVKWPKARIRKDLDPFRRAEAH